MPKTAFTSAGLKGWLSFPLLTASLMRRIVSRSMHRPHQLEWHHADFLFHLAGVHHHDGIPGAAVEESSVWTLAGALLATDTQDRVHLNAAERRIVFIGDPEHAVLDRTIFHAGRRAGAAGATFRNDRQLFWLFLARSADSFGPWFVLELVGHHPDRSRGGFGRHRVDYNPFSDVPCSRVTSAPAPGFYIFSIQPLKHYCPTVAARGFFRPNFSHTPEGRKEQ